MKSSGVMIGIMLISMFIVPSVVVVEEPSVIEDLSYLTDEEANLLDSTVNETAITQTAKEMMMSSFQENLGQIDNKDILFYGRIPGGMIGFEEHKYLIWLDGAKRSLVFEFIGSRDVQPIMRNLTTHKSNYFLGQRGTFRDVRSSTEIVYQDLWPGIDLLYKATSKGVKYEYQVSPGSDPKTIQMKCTGHDELECTGKTLKIGIDENVYLDDNLVAYQDEEIVEASFVLSNEDEFFFMISNYDSSKTLIIDPLIYSTYIGGNGWDYCNDIIVDESGIVYITGLTASTNFPIVNALNSTMNSAQDIFLLRLNASGNEILSSTYYGGSGWDQATAIALDQSNNIYLVGETASADFPTINAYSETFGGNIDCFVLKLNSTATELLYSTYLGGSATERGQDIAVDSDGYAYVTGHTESSGFPTLNAYDSTHNGATDVFVTKLNPTGSTLNYSTFVGDTIEDYAYGIDVDSSGFAYVTGFTTSYNFPHVNAYQSTKAGGGSDCFAFKLTPAGDSLVYSTYIGGSNNERGTRIRVDSEGSAYIVGYTESSNFPTVNAYDNTHGGSYDAFALKLNPAGDSLNYSTYIGGSDLDYGMSLTIDTSGNAYITGNTASTDFPVLHAYDSSHNGGRDCFLVKLSSLGFECLFSTLIGGIGDDVGTGISVSDDGLIYVAGRTASSDFPIVNAVDSTYDSNPDTFVFEIHDLTDSDNDTLWDFQEYVFGTDPFSADSDSDDLLDADEVYLYPTDPLNPDCDSDNLNDGDEILVYFTDPLNASEPGWKEALTYGTYFGGEEDDWAERMILLPGNVVIVLVDCYSENFPLVNPYDTTTNSHECAIFKLNLTSNQLIYSTYVGGSSGEYPSGLAVDSSGNAYVVGQTQSADFPIVGGLGIPYSGSSDVFIFKLNPAGNDLIYSTFFGGSGVEQEPHCVIDDLGNVYFTCVTSSTDINFNYTLGSSNIGICVVKINSTGNGIDYCSIVGSFAQPYEMAIDDSYNVYVIGRAWGSAFPMVNAYDDTFGGGDDVILFKVNPVGDALMFSTFIGGTGHDWGYGIDLDSTGNIYITGSTTSTDFPIVNGFDVTHNGNYDCFVMKFDSAASVVNFSTYIGGASDDYGKSIRVLLDQGVYIGGRTKSSDFPMKAPFDGSYNDGEDLFVAKLDLAGNNLLYSTYIGGSGHEYPRDLRLDSNGVVYFLSDTPSSNMPTPNGYDTTINGVRNPYIFKLSDNSDSDDDLLIDKLEDQIGTDKYDSDSDFDGLWDGYEYYTLGTNPANNDSDSDSIPDGWEFYNGLDPLVDDAGNDPDLDLLSNYLEYMLETEPLNNDTDSDSLLDGAEYYTYGTNPVEDDTDSDDMPDGWEIANGLNATFDDAYGDLDLDLLPNIFEWGNGTLANNNDTDSDMMPDGWEVNNGLNATLDDANEDLDADTLSNLGEYQNGTLPWNPDCDSDNLLDGLEILIYGTNPFSPHSDSDIMPDGWEVQHGLDPLSDDSLGDPDSDLLVNEDEYSWGTDPHNPDSDSDFFLDGYEVHTLGSDPLDPLSPSIQKEPVFSTFIGGNYDDTFYDAIVDSEGNVYITGYVTSTNFPVVEAYDSTHNGNWDTIVVKLNSTGNGIVFSTYIGGSSAERGLEFYIDSDFSVWLTGYTASSNFPVVNAYDSTHNGGWDGFIVHLSADGSSLLYSTFIGGSGDDLAEFITFDDDGYLYLSGLTRSSNFPVANGYDSSFNGDRDAFVLKMQPNLMSLVYSTFIGGSGYDYTYGSRLAKNGDFILTGVTTSSNFPMLNSYDSTYNGGEDIFATRLNADGNGLVFSTYIGGSGEEYFGKFDLDEDENLLMGGSTASTNFPTLNAYDATHNGNRDAFALKLASNGSAIYYSTFVGGSGDEAVYGVQVDQWGNIHLSGVTTSTDLPVKNAFQNESQGLDDTFVFKVNSTGNGLLYSTYLGGSANDGQRGMAIDTLGRVYIVGWTQSADHPVFNAYDNSLYGTSDGFVTCLPPLDDSDYDSIPDEIEFRIGSNRFSNDSDSDLMPDGWEYRNSLNVTWDDAALDEDLDGLINLDEYLYLTDPHNNDSDSDFLLDGLEVHTYGTNPNNPDSDSDGALDGLEVLTYGTSPTNPDSDTDTMPDGWEITYGLNPLENDALSDNDTDYLTNVDEYYEGTDPFNPDTDSDTILDGLEVHYLRSDPLDPLSAGGRPEFSTGLGGILEDVGTSIKYGPSNEIFVSGYTYSSDFPTVNAYDSTYNSNLDCFVLKLSPDGQTLLFSTFIGGYENDRAYGMAIDQDGNVIITGETQSFDFPTANAVYPSPVDGSNSFLLKLNSLGDHLIFSTYYGGDGTDAGYSIAVSDTGQIYFGGQTGSVTFPKINAYDTSYNGGHDAFLVSITPDGQSVAFSTYFGGSNLDQLNSIHLNSMGDIIISGITHSLDFPMVSPIDSDLENSLYAEGFVSKFDADGQTLQFSTYLGGSDEETGCFTEIDSNDNILAAGWTSSGDYPIVNAIDPTNNGDDMFLTKINQSLEIEFSTYLGGLNSDECEGIAIDDQDNVYLVGATWSSDFPMKNPFDGSHNGYSDVLVCVFSTTDLSIIYSTFYGGTSFDFGLAIDTDNTGNAVVTGYSDSIDFPLFDELGGINPPVDNNAIILKIPTILDQDGDGLSDMEEIIVGTSLVNPDTDSDLMLDGWEYFNGLNPLLNDSAGDLDSDTLTNLFEFYIGTLPNTNDTDSDAMPDAWEYYNGLNPTQNDANGDLDSDKLLNVQEFNIGSNPQNGDSDSDSMPDFWEYTYGLNLLVDDSASDLDLDGLSNLNEYLNGCFPNNGDTDSDDLGDFEEVVTYGSDPLNPDTDRDFLKDGYEVHILGSNPLLIDTDNDTLSDAFEALQFGTDPTLPDTDFDGMSDYEEYLAGTNPLVADANDDEDGDGLSNIEEWNSGTDIFNPDSDHDGVSDFEEMQRGRDPLRYDIPVPLSDMMIIGVLIIGSVIPALGITLLNERMFRRSPGSPRKKTIEELDTEREEK